MPYLYLVRHGQPDFAGNYDSITDLGARQSTWLGEHFAARGLQFARVLAGTLQRQVSTCELVMNALDGPRDFTQDARFNEYDHQSLAEFFEGDRLQAIKASGDRREYFAAIRSAMQKWSRHDDLVAGGESWAEFGARIRAGVIAACAGLGRDDNVLIVTSGRRDRPLHVGGARRGRGRGHSAEPADPQHRRDGSDPPGFGQRPAGVVQRDTAPGAL